MKNWIGYKTWILILILFALGTSWPLLSRRLKPETTQRLGTVRRESLVQQITISGTVEPLRTTSILPPYEGYIEKIFVTIGQQISAGAPVASVSQSPDPKGGVFPLRAPFSGKVVNVLKSPGQYVKPGDPKEYIARIDDLTKLFVHSNAPELEIPKMQIGQNATIKASALPNKSYKGVIREIAHAPNWRESWGRSQVEYQVKIEILDFDKQILPGMSSLVDIIANKKDDALVLAHEFVQKDKDQYFTILKDGRRKNVDIGLQNEFVTEIVAGLNEGDEVQQIDFLNQLSNEPSRK